jgi:hypothetical protein
MKRFILVFALVSIVISPSPLHAYVGPGAGLSAFGALVALVASVLVGIVGFVWYPMKRILRAIKRRNQPDEQHLPADIPAK